MRTTYLYLSLFCALGLLSFTSCGSSSTQEATNDTTFTDKLLTKSWNPQQDSSFLLQIYQSGRKLAQYNKLAAQKANTPAVKSFAEQTAIWHSKVNEEVLQLAAQKEVPLAEQSPEELKKNLEELKNLSADEFERNYLEALSKTQDNIISQCEKAAESAADSTIRAWARQVVPKLQAHAQAAEELTVLIKD